MEIKITKSVITIISFFIYSFDLTYSIHYFNHVIIDHLYDNTFAIFNLVYASNSVLICF